MMSLRGGAMNLGIREVLLIVAIICFVLDAVAILGDINLIALGLAFFAGAFLVPGPGLLGKR
jgi:hypothetical protein